MLSKLGGALLAAFLASAQTQSASLDVPYSPGQAQALVANAFRSLRPTDTGYRRYRLVTVYGAPLFPPNSYFNDGPEREQLLRWQTLTDEQRRFDLLLSPDVDFYWRAEDVAFACEFIVHIERTAGGRTRLTILQAHPVRYFGKKFHALGRTGPGLYRDVRSAPPSHQADNELNAFLLRNVPGASELID